ncbi:TlpA disulfide reductase family protein [uncultured Paraglaciecola sp.]|uniref:TlpA family protein disulfide reductase n=1 Tax=uncultured Paraglaciecola sp. TaxID=1765024 RepID=UPI0026244F20|nr:TlpA disulfide reductase family protein [uncultured Paraglaciecola sp.]
MKNATLILIAILALFVGLWTQQQLKVDFSTIDGQTHRWSNTQEKWTVVNYFAQWCAPCLREIPELNKFYQQNKGDIDIIAVSFDPLSNEQLLTLQQTYDIQFPIVEKIHNLPWTQPPSSLPTTYILNEVGKVQKQLKGEQSAEKLKRTIAVLKSL